MCGGFFCTESVFVATAYALACSPSQSSLRDASSPKVGALGSPRKLHLFAKASPFGRGGCERSEQTERARLLPLCDSLFSLPTPAICAIVTTFREKVSPSRWRNAKGGRDGKELLYRIIFYRKYGKNLLQIDNKRCIIYKWLWKPDTSSTDRLSLPVLRILCRRR